jgi:NAD(P)-dependent dehydrogenase (short-subunit alcohol dehydrogenase family)
MGAFTDRVAVVTGASRGIGCGIALALADEGATVYVTGRTVEPNSFVLPGTDGEILSGSVSETAAEVTRRGGKGIAVAVDHAKDDQVAALFAQIKREQGRLDILVNNAFQLPVDVAAPGGFWEKPLDYLQMLDVGLRSNYVAAWHAAHLMVPQKSGLIACTSAYAGVTYTHGALFGTGKSAVDRMARDMAIELKPHNVASLSLWLGLTLTERAKRNIKKHPERAAMLNPAVATSVELPGRVIAALAKDPDLMKRTGATYIAVELARDYGITDIDGKLAPSLRETRGAPLWSPV